MSPLKTKPRPWFMLLVLLAGGWVWFSLAGRAAAQNFEETGKAFIHGNYTFVITNAQAQLAADEYRRDWRGLLVRALLTVGRYEEAYTNAVDGLSGYAPNMTMQLLAREAALYQNKPSEANLRLAEIKARLEQRAPGYSDGEELVALGRALLLLGVEPRLVLENCFQKAQKLEPPVRDAFLAAGELALDKHDFKLAGEAFQAGLKKFPEDPDLEGGLAQAYESGNRGEMMKAIEGALSGNSNHVDTLLLLADHLIDAEQYAEAEKHLAQVLGVNPHEPRAWAYRAVLAELRNDEDGANKSRAEALAFYPHNPEVDHLIGVKLSQKYRFAEGAAAQQRALQFEPDFLPARRQLAEDLLRLGRNAEGWSFAESVHKQDGYDVTAYNLTVLHDTMEKFAELTNAHFIVHMSKHEAGLYGDLALDLLSRARATLTQKYGVELPERTVVEIFPQQKDFAVRTFGMPGNPGYLGVCFGSVITANSPASQAPDPANWEDVLWHEFCHVITLTATKNRMPRWLSEGISVYEERQTNPAWGERMNLEYRDIILKDGMTPVSKLSGAFLTASNLLFAYYESSLVVEFIAHDYGFENLKKILSDLGNGEEIYASIAKRTAPMEELQKKFDAFAREKAMALAPGVDLEKPPKSNDALEHGEWELLHPKNYYALVDKAEKAMEAKKWEEARPLLESAAELYHGERKGNNPLWLLAATERNLKDTNAELATLEKFAAQETDFERLYTRLVDLCVARKDWPATVKYAGQLLQINPLISTPHRGLAEAGVALGRPEQSILAYRKLLLLDPPDPVEAHFQLARLLHARGEAPDEARRNVLQALEDAPRYRDAQKLLLQIETGNSQPETGTPASKPESSVEKAQRGAK